jgi:2-C-methyl-D-erythritol 4-phosphate cytidylyltransferase
LAPNTEPTFAVVLAAGGRGLRFGGEAGVPKQFIELQGTPIYVWALSTLLASKFIGRAVIAAPPDMVAQLQKQLPDYISQLHEKPVSVVAGGDTRQASVFEAVKSLSFDPPDYILVHDAARPFLTADLVDRVVEGVIKYGACTVGIPCADTIKKSDGEHVAETISRDSMVLVQTPQAARYDWLFAAHEQCERDGYATTDDAAVLEHAGHKVGIVRGARHNLKLTEPEDLILAKALASIVFRDQV